MSNLVLYVSLIYVLYFMYCTQITALEVISPALSPEAKISVLLLTTASS